ncbi:MAG: ATP-binding protein, partial [Vicinamibacterales bacterium]
SVVDWEGGKASMTALIDVTERRRAEEQLRETQERFRQLADNIKEALIVAELPGFRPSFLSRMWGEIWQTDPEAALRHPTLWLDAIDPQDRAAVDDGQRRIERGEPAVTIFRIRRPDGSIRWARARMFPVVDVAGTVFRAVGLIEDITEIRHTEDLLRHAQKMEAVGRLAGGIAHDFNNLVTVILGYSELALDELPADHPLADAIGQIRTAGESAAGLTRQLLAFSRRQILAPKTIDLNAVLLRLRLLLRRVIGDDIQLHLNLTPTLATVEVDPGEIERVVMNLAVNARDAMPDGGHLTIESAIVQLDEAYASAHPGTAAGPHVMLAVSDSGTGMDEETQRQVFEPFFSTKGIGQGTGLGLATVYGIVRQSGGSIWVYSEAGRGTTFKIYLPRATSHPAGDAGERSAPDTWRGSETVLVIEDQPELRTLVCGALQRYGYRVLSATSGEEAFQISAEHQGALDLLLTDVVMAGLNGRRVAQRLHLERPQMRVIYMSGYTDQTIVRHGVLEPGLAFLQKPFTIQTLLRRVRETLDAVEPPGV